MASSCENQQQPCCFSRAAGASWVVRHCLVISVCLHSAFFSGRSYYPLPLPDILLLLLLLPPVHCYREMTPPPAAAAATAPPLYFFVSFLCCGTDGEGAGTGAVAEMEAGTGDHA